MLVYYDMNLKYCLTNIASKHGQCTLSRQGLSRQGLSRQGLSAQQKVGCGPPRPTEMSQRTVAALGDHFLYINLYIKM